jgi:ABC-type transport system involved in cytochrome bd biosynthesis fused ATPase/permease subunit
LWQTRFAFLLGIFMGLFGLLAAVAIAFTSNWESRRVAGRGPSNFAVQQTGASDARPGC